MDHTHRRWPGALSALAVSPSHARLRRTRRFCVAVFPGDGLTPRCLRGSESARYRSAARSTAHLRHPEPDVALRAGAVRERLDSLTYFRGSSRGPVGDAPSLQSAACPSDASFRPCRVETALMFCRPWLHIESDVSSEEAELCNSGQRAFGRPGTKESRPRPVDVRYGWRANPGDPLHDQAGQHGTARNPVEGHRHECREPACGHAVADSIVSCSAFARFRRSISAGVPGLSNGLPVPLAG